MMGDYKLHHVGVVVRSLEAGLELFSLFGAKAVTPRFHDPLQEVHLQFVSAQGDVLIELIEPASETSPVRDHFRRNALALNHLCFSVPDIESACAEAREKGAMIVSPPKPAVAFAGRRVAFLYRSNNLFEFLEETHG
jgi:methylmalonyl-CoA/ethylmalonyl-CoA epimerase